MTETRREWFKKWAWKLVGALIMRDKGSQGKEVQAVSAHKLLGLILFAVCTHIWVFGGVELELSQQMEILSTGGTLPSKWGEPPDLLVYSWLALLGVVDVAKSALGVFRK